MNVHYDHADSPHLHFSLLRTREFRIPKRKKDRDQTKSNITKICCKNKKKIKIKPGN